MTARISNAFDFRALARACASAAADHKGRDIVGLDVRRLSSVTDYFILATGNTEPHVTAIREAVESAALELGLRPIHLEGRSGTGWQVLDFGGGGVPVFQPAARKFYGLDRLWADAKALKL